MKYNVHVFAVVRVKVNNVEAKDHTEAMDKAFEEMWADHERFTADREWRVQDEMGISYIELAEDEPATHYLVDEQGDEQYENSAWYNSRRLPMTDADGLPWPDEKPEEVQANG